MSYKVKLEIFEGPLDLLLYLVKKDHLNIYDIPIAKVTEQYLQYLELMRLLDLNIAGEFLVIAATLMQIKSKMLLPAEEGEENAPQEDPREELVRRLLEYERFKEIAQQLREKESSQKEIFKRPKAAEKEQLAPQAGEVYFEASVFDLLNAFSKALENVPKDLFYEVIKDEFSVQDKIHEILHLLLVRNSVHISELFNRAGSKMEIIVIFLAILELIRLKEILAQQKEYFGEIVIVRNKDNILPYEKRDKTKTD